MAIYPFTQIMSLNLHKLNASIKRHKIGTKGKIKQGRYKHLADGQSGFDHSTPSLPQALPGEIPEYNARSTLSTTLCVLKTKQTQIA